MMISQQGINFIALFEGFSSKPYKDPASGGEPITIGIGSTHYCDGTKVTIHDTIITILQAQDMLKCYIDNHISPYLNNTFPHITQTQFDSLCSFCYNLGTGALDKSSLKHAVLNKAGADEITEDFDKWDMAGGHVMAGLLNRRQHEAKLFLTGQYI